jgi:hypothetical protein
VILLHDIVEVLHLPNQDWQISIIAPGKMFYVDVYVSAVYPSIPR